MTIDDYIALCLARVSLQADIKARQNAEAEEAKQIALETSRDYVARLQMEAPDAA